MNSKLWKQAAKRNRKGRGHWFGMAVGYYLPKWRDTQKLLHPALERLVEIDCGCESGGEYVPEYICGWHQALYALEDEL
jgi:hypothetical protein